MKPATLCLIILSLCFELGGFQAPLAAPQRKPNIIFILADDLGYGDLGSYGQKQIKTPNLDRLAREGIRFTNFYAGAPVCAPSRASLMTGLHQGHAYIRGNTTLKPVPGQSGAGATRLPLRPEDVTVAEVLKSAGYATGLIGKWGLGEPETSGIPNRQGFDYFFGYLNQNHAHNYYPDYLWRNQEQVKLSHGEYSHDLFTREALAFIRRQQSQPFFLYLAYTLPHANNELGRKTGNGMEVPNDAPYTQESWRPQEKNYAAMVTRLDADIGRVMSLVRELGLDQDTIVFFNSDNGPQGPDEGGFDPNFFASHGKLRGIKRDLYEGGIRVPLIVRWPGRIKPDTTSDQIAAGWDLLPTLATLAGARVPLHLDGISFSPLLFGQGGLGHKYLYWEFHEGEFSQAVRMKNWKAVRKHNKPLELYDLKSDPGEQRDVAAANSVIASFIERVMNQEHIESEYWPVR